MKNKIDSETLNTMLDQHELWIKSGFKKGQRADFSNADLSGVDLRNRNLSGARFANANLRRAKLVDSIFHGTNLGNADLSEAEMFDTVFRRVDLSHVKGLDTVVHHGPSTIGIDTIFRSKGKISDVFLRNAGTPEDFIEYIKKINHMNVKFNTCFISYSTKDEIFARKLYTSLQKNGIAIWFAPEDIKGGVKIHEQLEHAIQNYDKLLLILSENSINSEWVITEIRNARRFERESKERKLFPIRLVDFETLKKWKCFDSDIGKDLAIEVREYFIPDFSNWEDSKAYEEGVKKLLRDLDTSS